MFGPNLFTLMSLRFKAVLLICALFSPRVLGGFVNRTIDDQYGDLVTGSQASRGLYLLTNFALNADQVQYSPDNTWTQGNNCDFCAAKPSNASAFNGTQAILCSSRLAIIQLSEGTWHDGTWDPSRGIEPLAFTFSFNGAFFLNV